MRASPGLALIRRELLTSLREAKVFGCLVLLMLVCILVEVGYWPGQHVSMYRLSEANLELLVWLSFVLMGGAVLFMPGLAGSAIVREREEGTFDLVAASLARPSVFVLSKLINVVGLYMLLIIGSLPVFGVLLYGVGIDWVQLAAVVVVLLLTTTLCATLGLMASALFHRTVTAVVMSYVIIVIGFIIPPVALTFFAYLIAFFTGLSRADYYITQLMPIIYPPFTLFALLGAGGPIFGRTVPGVLAWSFLYQSTVSGICFLVAWRYVTRERRKPETKTGKPIDDPQLLQKRRRTFPYYLIDPLKRPRPVEDGTNPMRVRETRWGLLSRSAVLVRVFYVVFAVYFLGAIATAYLAWDNAESDASGWIIFEMCALVVIAPALLANTFTKERELGNIDMLRMTLLHPHEIVLGKAAAALMALAPALLAAALAAVPLYIGIPSAAVDLTVGHVAFLICACLSLSLGMYASLVSNNTPVALVRGYVFAFLLFGGVALAYRLVLGSLWDGATPQNASQAFLYSPIGAYAVFAFREDLGGHHPGKGIASLAAFFLLSVALLSYCIWHFKMYKMRD